jgi:uncharacterized protein YfaS (alpha-2-macroglobulin family)
MRGYYGGQGPVIKRETIKTDATGKATLTFDTPRENYNQDYEYRIEARVTDSSRREIIAGDTVRVTRQRYYVYPRAEQNIYRPKDKVTVDIKSGALAGSAGFSPASASRLALMNFNSASDFTGRTRWVYQELRDRKVALFIDHLPEGVWQLSYEMRAESPGAFHALPILGHAMYVPEIRTNGTEVRIRIVD